MLSNTIKHQKNFFSESKLLLMLAIPLIMSGVIETSVGFFSNIFLARLGTETLAAGGLVNWVYATLMIIVWGSTSAVTTLAARYYGENNLTEIRCILYASLLLILIMILPATLIMWNLSPILLFFGQKPSIVALAEPYLHSITYAIIPDFLVTILLQFIVGLGRTKTNLVFSLLFVPINLIANYCLMFGKFGLPALGIAGIGWGASFTFWILVIGFYTYFFLEKSFRIYFKIPDFYKIYAAAKEIIHIGLPLGLMYCLEVAFFLAISIITGLISESIQSANQITLQFYWLFSVVTFSFAQAITIKVAHSIGQNDRQAINYATYLGVFYTSAFMFITALLYWFFAGQLISIDLKSTPENASIINLAKAFFSIAALIQLTEAVRFSFFAALRAFKDTRYTLFNSILIYWLLALPLGCLLAFRFNMGGLGIWWAWLIGQIIGTPLLIWRCRRKIKEYFV